MSHVKLSNSNLDLFSLRRTSKTLAAVFNLFEIFIIDFSVGALCSESTLTSWVPPSRALIASFLSRSPLTLIVPTNNPLLSRSLSSQVERVIHTIPCIKHHKNFCLSVPLVLVVLFFLSVLMTMTSMTTMKIITMTTMTNFALSLSGKQRAL